VVVVISSPQCQPCRITKSVLEKMGVDFVERNVAEDTEALELAQSLGHKQTPVVILPSGESWSGLRPDLLANLIA
jgi:glutaredoxin-like protein NrdH